MRHPIAALLAPALPALAAQPLHAQGKDTCFDEVAHRFPGDGRQKKD